MFRRPLRRRSRRAFWPILSRVFYINPQKQYMLIVISAIAMATLVFSGLLLFRQSDHGDLMTRGKWLMRQGKVALAVKDFESLVRQYPKSYDGHLELGKAYMAIDESEKAAKEFQYASLLRAKNLKESGAHVAISRMMVAQGNYQDAEKQLFQAYKARPENRKDKELLSALTDLYEEWGDFYMAKSPPDVVNAFPKYVAALRYVRDFEDQRPLEDKLHSTAEHLADHYSNLKEYDQAIAVLKTSLKHGMRPNTLVSIAALYEKRADLDKAIYWYRKAYEQDPKIISIKLSTILVQKGRELNELHRPDEAQKYFEEAAHINETVKLPLDTLYPVGASNVQLTYQINPSTVDMQPTAKFNINNDSSYPIQYLRVKAFFLTGEKDQDEKLGDAMQVIATDKNPLAPKGEPRGTRPVEMQPGVTIPLEDLDAGKLRLKVMVTYSDDTNAKWVEIKNAEITIPEAAKMNADKPKPTT